MSFRKFVQRILTPPVIRLANRFSAKPDKQRVHLALTKLYYHIRRKPGKKGFTIHLDKYPQKIIVFSDLHKGNKKHSDDFAPAEQNYLAALAGLCQSSHIHIYLVAGSGSRCGNPGSIRYRVFVRR